MPLVKGAKAKTKKGFSENIKKEVAAKMGITTEKTEEKEAK